MANFDSSGTLELVSIDKARRLIGRLKLNSVVENGTGSQSIAVDEGQFSAAMAGAGRDRASSVNLSIRESYLRLTTQAPDSEVSARLRAVVDFVAPPTIRTPKEGFRFSTGSPKALRSAYLYFGRMNDTEADSLLIRNDGKSVRFDDEAQDLSVLIRAGQGEGQAEAWILKALLNEATRVAELQAVKRADLFVPVEGWVKVHYDLDVGGLTYYVSPTIRG